MNSSDALIARFLGLHPKSIDLSLGRIERLLASLDHPERKLPPIIHVAGTNGKGSTIAFMRSILEAANLSVHVYTSPHLVRFHERIRLGNKGGGAFVDEERLVEALQRCEQANDGHPITVFEMTTAAALLLFSETPADVLLLEVGLGGRLDATNVVIPHVAVVTSIGLDHIDYLGPTIASIAGEKAGIFKQNCAAVIAPQDYAEADDILSQKAEHAGASPVMIGKQDFTVYEENGRLVYQDEEVLLDLPRPRLLGRHQITNAGTAIAALRCSRFKDAVAPYYEQGILYAQWPARLQRLPRGNLHVFAPEGAELWLDGGHNPDGAKALSLAFADLADQSPAPLVLVVGMLGTKDSETFLQAFKGLTSVVVAVPVEGQVAARPVEEICMIAEGIGFECETALSIESALAQIDKRNFSHPPRILICGSLYLAGHVLAVHGIHIT